jgi:hypothetical protein
MITSKHRSFFLQSILPIVVLAVLLPVSVPAQTDRHDDLTTFIQQHAVWDPAEFVLDKLRSNRIVMVADMTHGDPLYYKVIINSLNHWMSAWEQSSTESVPKDLPSKLFLFIEKDSVQVNSLKHYFQTGNPIDIIEPINYTEPQFTTGKLEFYDDLRTFRIRVDSFNRIHAGRQISFDIVGPEQVIDVGTWTTEKRERFFISERDEYSSARIGDFLDHTPDAKALVYYGGAHLERGKVMKVRGNPKSMGRYLAQYLSERFASNGGVYTCSQFDIAPPLLLDQAIMKIGKTFAADNSIYAGVAVDRTTSFPPFDGAIYHFVRPRNVRPIFTVFSENLVDYIFDHIDSYTDSTREFYRMYLDAWLRYLSSVAIRDLRPLNHADGAAVDSTIKAWKDWRRGTKLNIVEDLSTLEFFKRILNHIKASDDKLSDQYQRNVLEPFIGFKVWFQYGASPQVRADSIWMFINKYRKQIVTENLIHLLWVASDSEKQKAMAILKKETGENFSTAKEWSSWWETRQSK